MVPEFVCSLRSCSWLLSLQSWRLPGSTDRITALTKENFERIADGMTQAEVEAILGPPMSVEIYENTNWGTMVTWETRRIEGHLVYMRSINISFDPSGRKWGIGQYTNCPLDIDSWTQFRLSVVDSSPWLAQQLDWLP